MQKEVILAPDKPRLVNIYDVNVFAAGSLQLMVGLCEKKGIEDIFDQHLAHGIGKLLDIAVSIEAETMLAGMCAEQGSRPC